MGSSCSSSTSGTTWFEGIAGGRAGRMSVLGTIFLALIAAGCAGGGSDTLDASDGGSGGGTTSTSSITLFWDAPPVNEDGTALQDLGGYKVYDGPASGQYDTVTDVGRTTNVTLEDLPPGTYYITVTAYDVSGNESGFSNEIVVELQ